MSSKSNVTELLLKEVSESLKSIAGSLKTLAEKPSDRGDEGKLATSLVDALKEFNKPKEHLVTSVAQVQHHTDVPWDDTKHTKHKTKSESHQDSGSDKKSDK